MSTRTAACLLLLVCACSSAPKGTIGSAGGMLQTSDGSGVNIPPGALSSNTVITATPVPAAAPPSGMVLVGTPYLFGPEGQQFKQPVTLALAFDPGRLPEGATPHDIVVLTAPAGSTDYMPMQTTLSDATHVQVQTTHFSIFMPVAHGHSGDGGSDDAGTQDAGAVDAGTVDAGAADSGMDSGANDAGAVDAGADDAGTDDAGAVDAGTDDAGAIDSGTVDAGAADAGAADAGAVDAGQDAGAVDAGPPVSVVVTPIGDGHETFDPANPVAVLSGSVLELSVTANVNYELSQTVGGTCPMGHWQGNLYFTGVIEAPCSVAFSAHPPNVTVTSATMDFPQLITIMPLGSQLIAWGATASFTVTVPMGYLASVDLNYSTCPMGTWSGAVYTTGPIMQNCTVEFDSVPMTYQVTASGDGNETFMPAQQTVTYGNAVQITVSHPPQYTVSVGGTCPIGMGGAILPAWIPDYYDTGPITSDCTVTFSASPAMFQVTASGDGLETITPSGTQTVGYNATQTFTVTVDPGRTLSQTVQGTCPPGQWSGNAYTTGQIYADCTVSFHALHTATATGDSHETITAVNAQGLEDGATATFTVQPVGCFQVSPTVAGTCPAGSFSGSLYTTGPITADCTVTFASMPADTQTDVNNCGSCGNACPADADACWEAICVGYHRWADWPLPADDPASSNYTVDSTNGVVTDLTTGLLWQRGTAPPLSNGAPYTWEQAYAYCQNLSLGPHTSGWRLPSVMELLSIADYSGNKSTVFPVTGFPYFWTSTPGIGASSYFWMVDTFGSTVVFSDASLPADSVRCVQ